MEKSVSDSCEPSRVSLNLLLFLLKMSEQSSRKTQQVANRAAEKAEAVATVTAPRKSANGAQD